MHPVDTCLTHTTLFIALYTEFILNTHHSIVNLSVFNYHKFSYIISPICSKLTLLNTTFTRKPPLRFGFRRCILLVSNILPRSRLFWGIQTKLSNLLHLINYVWLWFTLKLEYRWITANFYGTIFLQLTSLDRCWMLINSFLTWRCIHTRSNKHAPGIQLSSHSHVKTGSLVGLHTSAFYLLVTTNDYFALHFSYNYNIALFKFSKSYVPSRNSRHVLGYLNGCVLLYIHHHHHHHVRLIKTMTNSL